MSASEFHWFPSDAFIYFRSLKEVLEKDEYFAKIVEALKNEVYIRPNLLQLDENSMCKLAVLSEKELYAQWILETVIKKLSSKAPNLKFDIDCTTETLSRLRKIMLSCQIPAPDVFKLTLDILNNRDFTMWNDAEHDFLIFLHVTSRIQNILELMKIAEFSRDSTQMLCSKAKRCELEKKYIQLLYKLKNLLEGMQKVSISNVFIAITKSRETDVEIQEMINAYDSFKNYLSCASGQTTDADELYWLSEETKKVNALILHLFGQLDAKIQECIMEGQLAVCEDLGLALYYDTFQEDKVELITQLKKLNEKMNNMAINDINDVRILLNSLRDQVKSVLISKWNFQKQLLHFLGCEDGSLITFLKDNEEIVLQGHLYLLFEILKDSLYHLKILDEIEFSKNFVIMSGLCRLRENKDVLIEEFRNFLIRIGHQRVKDAPAIKKSLYDFDQEIYILYKNYHDYKTQLQFLNNLEAENMTEMFFDFEDLIRKDIVSAVDKSKTTVGMLIPRKFTLKESQSKPQHQRITHMWLKEIERIVDQTMDSLRTLDETIISKDFAAMRCVCELHNEKCQIISAFEKLLEGMQKLGIQDSDCIYKRLMELSDAATILSKKYEILGTQIIMFSDVMAIVNDENLKNEKCSITQNFGKILEQDNLNFSISDVFGSTEELKRCHRSLDKLVQNQWFPYKEQLPKLYTEKQRSITELQNFLDRTPDFSIEDTLPALHEIRNIIMKAENIMRKYLSLRMQLMWLAGESVVLIEKFEAKYRHENNIE